MNNSQATDTFVNSTAEHKASNDFTEPMTATPVTDAVTAQEDKPSAAFALFRKYASLSDLLRYVGALSVAIAMGVFLIEGAQALTDIQRFLTMLGFTGALTGAGFLMSLLLKEQRGSRVFVALALLSVPVNFTVFGALIYSFIPLDGIAISYPGFAAWQVAGASEIVLAIGAGAAVLLPVASAGFTVLARTERRWLSAALLLSSAALIIPVRHEVIVAVIAMLAACSSLWLLHRYGRGSLALKTIEGRFAKSLLFVAPLIIVGRSLFLYDASGVLLLMLSGGTYFATRQLLNSRGNANWFTAVATLFASALTFGISASVFAIGEKLIQGDYAIIVATVVFLLVNCDLVRVSANRKLASALSVLNSILATCLIVALALFEGGSVLVSVCVAVLCAMIVAAYTLHDRAMAVIATAGLAAIGVTYVDSVWSTALSTGWWGIAALGVIAIIAGSLIDRAGTVVKSTQA